jgi:DNA polymerase III alpha subunit
MRVRTGYSFGEVYGPIDAIFKRTVEVYKTFAPITDRASTFGFAKWNRLCREASVRPIFGVELAVASDLKDRRAAIDYWTFIAKDELQSVFDLLKIATEQFYYEPRLTYEQANSAKGVFRIIGRRSLIDRIVPDVDTFFALGSYASPHYVNEMLRIGVRPIACSDNTTANGTDEEIALQTIISGRQSSIHSQAIMTDEEWGASCDYDCRGLALSMRDQVALGSRAALQKSELLSPEKKKTLVQLCREGAKRLGVDLKNAKYKERLERELKLIADKKFEDYFFIIADICQWARKRMIVGPARGSSCGSLVCYLLEITTVDPIRFDLLFERFIDVSRNDLPDIDIDFSDTRRHLVFDYIKEKYGEDHVARLGTVSLFKPRSAMQEFAKALDVPIYKINNVSDALIKRSGGDSRALDTLIDTLRESSAGIALLKEHPEMALAAKLEGHPSHHSQHAAGILITKAPLTTFVGIDGRTGATHCDKRDAEELDLLKIDALGLTQLSIFEDALALCGLPMDHLFKLPFDDRASLDILNQEKFCGIFQFNGTALRSITKQVKVKDFEDIVSITAIARPGPMASGGASEWVRRKNGQVAISYINDAFRKVLQSTLGVVTYQEQVMQIGFEIGGLSWQDVTALRKAMSKSLGKEYFDKFGDKFKAGAARFNIDKQALDRLWDDLCAYGSWAFNRSHAVAYGIISYWCCWFKAHHPLEFAAASLQHQDSTDRQLEFLRELHREGTNYVAVDEKLSTDRWTIANKGGEKVLIGPVNNIKGIGPKMVSEIASARARGEPIPARAQKLLTNPVTDIDSLWPIQDAVRKKVGALNAVGIVTPPTKIVDIEELPEDKVVLAIGVFSKIQPRDENEDVNIARRGGKRIVGNLTRSLNLFLRDETGEIFVKVGRFDYDRLGMQIINRGKVGKCVYAIKGIVPGKANFKMVRMTHCKFLCEL